jgi:hypothetical protein
MKNTTQLIQKIHECNLSGEDKKTLIEALNNKSGNYAKFVIEFLKIIGLSKKVFDLFDIDIGDWIDKFF